MTRASAYFTIILSFLSASCFAQVSGSPDSLLKLIATTKDDSLRFEALIEYGSEFTFNNPDSAIYYHNKAFRLATASGNYFRMAVALRSLGLDHFNESALVKAEQKLRESIAIAQKCLDRNKNDKRVKKLLAADYGYIGMTLKERGLPAPALENLFKSLMLSEELANKKNMAVNYSSIGNIYDFMGEYDKALDYYSRSQKLNVEIGNKRGMSGNLVNTGIVYQRMKRHSQALKNFMEGLKIDEEIGSNTLDIINDHVNIGTALMEIGDSAMRSGNKTLAYKEKFPAAKESFLTALRLSEKMNLRKGRSLALTNLGALAMAMNQKEQARDFLEESLALADSMDFFEEKMILHQMLSDVYEDLTKPSEALLHYKYYLKCKDSINSSQNTRNMLQQEYKFNYEKKVAADSVAFAKEKEVREAEILRKNAELKAKRNQQIALFGGVVLVLLFSLFIYKRFQITNRQKRIIEEQKQVVEEKQREVLDSIRYAKRIQTSLLPSEKLIEKLFSRLKNSNA